MSQRYPLRWSLIAAAAIFSQTGTPAATVQGQITDAGTGLPLEGARVEIDVSPPDGTPEFTGTSDLFGFYTVGDLSAGASVRLTASRGGYVAVERDATLSADASTENFALTRDGGPEPIDIYVTVVDASSGFPLLGIPVQARWFAGSGGTVPDDTFTLTTDGDGAITFFGMPSGFYDFAFNDGGRPGWERFPKSGGFSARQAISSPHAVNLQLKHIPQAIKVSVTGCDPRTEEEGPLENVWVELAGVSPDDHDVIIIPPREGPTNEFGEITFFNLAPLHWRVRTKKMGHVQAEAYLVPDASDNIPGRQPGGAFPIHVDLEPTSLTVTLTSLYDDLGYDFYEGIEVTLEGLEESETEGIFRQVDTGNASSERFFDKLMPGRYTLRVNDQYEPDDPETEPAPHFIAETTVEIIEGEATEFDFPLDVRPAVIRARLYASDTLASMDTDGENDPALRRPIYAPMEVPDLQIGIAGEVVEKPTDADGYATFVVSSGLLWIRRAQPDRLLRLPPALPARLGNRGAPAGLGRLERNPDACAPGRGRGRADGHQLRPRIPDRSLCEQKGGHLLPADRHGRRRPDRPDRARHPGGRIGAMRGVRRIARLAPDVYADSDGGRRRIDRGKCPAAGTVDGRRISGRDAGHLAVVGHPSALRPDLAGVHPRRRHLDPRRPGVSLTFPAATSPAAAAAASRSTIRSCPTSSGRPLRPARQSISKRA
ncbi:MAG: carboxypeptidase-like regulatory domain-containing protein [Verrucomicrobiales bacterium]